MNACTKNVGCDDGCGGHFIFRSPAAIFSTVFNVCNAVIYVPANYLCVTARKQKVLSCGLPAHECRCCPVGSSIRLRRDRGVMGKLVLRNSVL